MRNVFTILFAATLLAGCGDKNGEKAAAALLEEARAELAAKSFDRALALVDSLRRSCPKAVEGRRAALKLYQEASLAKAQAEVAALDGRLQQLEADYSRMQAEADAARAALRATPQQLEAVALKRMERDSVRTAYETACAKIKYIHRRQAE